MVYALIVDPLPKQCVQPIKRRVVTPYIPDDIVHKDNLRLATPCQMTWSQLEGEHHTERHCAQCQTTVHNLSHMTESQARALIESREPGLCVIYQYDEQGQVQFEPEHISSARWLNIRRLLLGAAMVLPMVPMLTACGGMERNSQKIPLWAEPLKMQPDPVSKKVQEDEKRALDKLERYGITIENAIEPLPKPTPQ